MPFPVTPKTDTRRFAPDPMSGRAKGLIDELVQNMLTFPERSQQFWQLEPDIQANIAQNMGLNDMASQMRMEQERVSQYGGIRAPRWYDPDQFSMLGMGLIGAMQPMKGEQWAEEMFNAIRENPKKIPLHLKEAFTKIPEVAEEIPAIRAVFGQGFGEEGKAFMREVEKNRNISAIHPNSKTGLSLDFTTLCCNVKGAKGPCVYCYVEAPRTGVEKLGKEWMRRGMKKVVETPYTDEIARMPDEVVTELNLDGGLRHQSFSDWMPQHKRMFDKVLEDAVSRKSPANPQGLIIKTITKDPKFVKLYGDHPNVRINFSVDELPRWMSNSTSIDQAMALKQGSPNLMIRSVARNKEEAIKQALDPRIDVVTLYHGETGESLWKTVQSQNPALIKKYGEKKVKAEIMKFQDMSKGAFKEQLYHAVPGKVCCGKKGGCSMDATKCGYGVGGVGALIMGVELGKRGE